MSIFNLVMKFTLFKWATNLWSDENVNGEVDNVKKILKINDYNSNIISSSLTGRNTSGVGESQANRGNFKYVSVPYIKGASERVDEILQVWIQTRPSTNPHFSIETIKIKGYATRLGQMQRNL